LRYGDMSKDRFTMRRYKIAKEMLDAKTDNRVLDIGCYDGYFISTIDADTYGFDTDGEALKVASDRGIKTLDSLKIPFKFDKIVCMEVLEHLQDPLEMVKEIKRLLTPGGRVLISLPNECTLWHRIKMLLGWGVDSTGFVPWYHLHFPTLKQNDRFISKNFEIIQKRYWVYGLPQWFACLPTLFARGVIYECY
jgi:SAM-dependent methyltransferase